MTPLSNSIYALFPSTEPLSDAQTLRNSLLLWHTQTNLVMANHTIFDLLAIRRACQAYVRPSWWWSNQIGAFANKTIWHCEWSWVLSKALECWIAGTAPLLTMSTVAANLESDFYQSPLTHQSSIQWVFDEEQDLHAVSMSMMVDSDEVQMNWKKAHCLICLTQTWKDSNSRSHWIFLNYSKFWTNQLEIVAITVG